MRKRISLRVTPSSSCESSSIPIALASTLRIGGGMMAVADLRRIIFATSKAASGVSTSSERLGIFEMRSVASSRARFCTLALFLALLLARADIS